MKFIILPLWFVHWIVTVEVNNHKIAPWKYPINGDSQWICNYDSYPIFYKQFDSLLYIEGKLDTVTIKE